MLPVVDFFGTDVTRLILGDNPAHANSYIHDIYTNEEMGEYYTFENVLKMLRRAKETGQNTILALATTMMKDALRIFNKEEGGGLQVIFQTNPYELDRFNDAIDEMAEFNPLGIYHQGSTGETYIETGNIKQYLENFNYIKSKGVPAGMAFHDPANLMLAEKENWGADFYVLCPYNSRRNRKGEQSSFITGKSKSDLVFHPEDRFTMYKHIRELKQPVIVIKALAGGQILIGKKEEEYPAIIEEYLKEAYNSIKPCDIICIGVFQRDTDQLKQNADIVSRILNK